MTGTEFASGRRSYSQASDCSFLANMTNYLGQDIRPDWEELFAATAAAVRKIENRTTQKELKSFSGLENMVAVLFLAP